MYCTTLRCVRSVTGLLHVERETCADDEYEPVKELAVPLGDGWMQRAGRGCTSSPTTAFEKYSSYWLPNTIDLRTMPP